MQQQFHVFTQQYCNLSSHHSNFSPNGNTTHCHLFVVVIFKILLENVKIENEILSVYIRQRLSTGMKAGKHKGLENKQHENNLRCGWCFSCASIGKQTRESFCHSPPGIVLDLVRSFFSYFSEQGTIWCLLSTGLYIY